LSATQRSEIGLVSRQYRDHCGGAQIDSEIDVVVVSLDKGDQPLGGADCRDDLRKLEMPIGNMHEQHAVGRKVREITAQRLAREQVYRNGVGGKGIEHD